MAIFTSEHRNIWIRWMPAFWILIASALTGGVQTIHAVGEADPGLFPITTDEMDVHLYARDPVVRNPCAIAFDWYGRLFVGMGPQYRNPKPATEGDSVYILVDRDGDGVAEDKKLFATGFNSIQGLLCGDHCVYVANAPDFTLVQDVNGDDVGDVYIKLFTDLGNLEHGLHGLNWGPDGKLYMSKGNSKGLSQSPDRIAPRPFRDLWGVKLTAAPDFPEPVIYTPDEYVRNFHDPNDDWGRQGGVLRCNPDGSGLEIFSAGNRNPWDIAFDNEFNWLGTDNDQNLGDKIFSPFHGAHFGWGHEWSSDWEGIGHWPTVPASGPLFEGSGTGVTWWDVDGLPDSYRGVFLINDWLQREVFTYRPGWDGALMKPMNGVREVLAHAGSGRDMSISQGRSFDPVDLEVGPDGQVYISSWGREYGASYDADGQWINEGRIYKLAPRTSTKEIRLPLGTDHFPEKFSTDQLIDGLDREWMPIRLKLIQDALVEKLSDRSYHGDPWSERIRTMSPRGATWMIHALARAGYGNELAGWLESFIHNKTPIPTGQLIQWIRCVPMEAIQGPYRSMFEGLLAHPEPRIRHAVVLALRHHQPQEWSPAIARALERENDRIVYYSLWRLLGDWENEDSLTSMLRSKSVGIRRGALLALLESGQARQSAVESMKSDPDPSISALARKWLNGADAQIIRGNPLPESPQLARHTVPAPDPLTPPGTRFFSGNPKSRWVTAGPGEKTYSDRSYSIRRLPDEFMGMALLQTPNEDDRNPEFGMEIRFDIPSRLFVAHDIRIPPAHQPAWLSAFQPYPGLIHTEDSQFQLFIMNAGPGTIQLGANTKIPNPPYGMANYFVLVGNSLPSNVSAQTKMTKLEDVLPLLPRADILRGRDLFLSTNGAACAACHRMDGIGNSYAPDLSGIGSRASADFIISSILDPDLAITEGYRQVAISTVDGGVFSGMILNETSRQMDLVLLNGEVVTVPRDQIESRETLNHSAMPGHFSMLLDAAQVADITRWLTTQTRIQPTPSHNQQKPPDNITRFWKFDLQDDQLTITWRDQDIATYWTSHPQMSRPGFSNIHSLSGAPITRPFPAGPEADHQFMHPGISLSFGWLDGHDFWRMKARVEHLRFIQPPSVQAETLTFSVKNRYVSTDGQSTVCYEISQFSFHPRPFGIVLDWQSSFYSDDHDFTFGDQEESGLAIRMAPDLIVRAGAGSIRASHGGLNESGTWGKSFEWIEYSGIRNGQRLGIAIQPDFPDGRTCWAHSRDYGVLVANPFPRQSRSQRDPIHPTTIPRFQPFVMAYRLVLFELGSDRAFTPDLFSDHSSE